MGFAPPTAEGANEPGAASRNQKENHENTKSENTKKIIRGDENNGLSFVFSSFVFS